MPSILMFQSGTKKRGDSSLCTYEHLKPKFQESSGDLSGGLNENISSQTLMSRYLKDGKNRDTAIVLLKKEIECALESFNGVKAEMAKLYDEKEKLWMSGKESKRSLEALVSQVLVLQSGMDCFEAEFKSKIDLLNGKLQRFEEIVQSSCTSKFQEKEVGYPI